LNAEGAKVSQRAQKRIQKVKSELNSNIKPLPEVVCVASWNADLTSRIAHPLAVGETVAAQGFSISPGGKGSNAAVAAARMGAQVGIVARIGGDAFGQMALALWAAEGIATTHVEQAKNESSGVAQILVYDSGDNSIAVSAGANAGLAVAHVQAAASMIANARVVMASNEVPLPVVHAAFSMARLHGVTTLLNPAPAVPLTKEFRALLGLCDIITPNEGELRALAGVPASAPLQAAVAALLATGVRAIVVTLGEKGCALYRAGVDALHIAGWPVQVADTVGAGDTLTGALAACLASGLTLDDAVVHANAAAALSVTRHGALGGMPLRFNVDLLLKK
jgi:ribokinase